MRHEHLTSSARTSEITPEGYTIIAREYNALSPHPNPSQQGRLVPSTGLNKILVVHEKDDPPVELDLYECDTCGKTDPSSRSVIAHMTSHNPERFNPDTDTRVIRRLLQIAQAERNVTLRDYAVRTATQLNEEGVKPANAETWSPAMVSRMWNRWANDDRFRSARRKSRTVPKLEKLVRSLEKEEKSPEKKEKTLEKADGTSITDQVVRMAAKLETCSMELRALAAIIAQLDLEHITETIEKAKKFDALKATLGDLAR